MGNEWQVVQNSKAKVKRNPQGKGESAALNGSSAESLSNGGNAALAKLDAEWSNKTQGQSKADARNDFGSFHSLQVEDSPPPSPKRKQEPGSQAEPKPVKPKKPKVKKVTTAEIAAGLQAESLKAFLDDLEVQYASDENAQLERLGDYFLASFKEADIPFNKTVLEQPLSKSAETPVKDLSVQLALTTQEFLSKKDSHSLAGFTSSLIKMTLQDIPESQSKNQAPTKAKVGILILLSLILRTQPEVLILLSTDLLSNGHSYSSKTRLPFQLWIIQQTASVDLGVAVSVWTRVLLPQILGQELPAANASSNNKAPSAQTVRKLSGAQLGPTFGFVEDIFAESHKAAGRPPKTARLGPSDGDLKGYFAVSLTDSELLRSAQEGISIQGGGKSVAEPVVPSGAIEAVTRSCYGTEPEFGPTVQRNRLLHIQGQLRDLYLMGAAAGHNKVQEAVRLALDTATLAADQDTQSQDTTSDLVLEVARNILELIHADPKGTTSAWEGRHKHQIKGSAAVLRYLSSHPPDLQELMKNSHRRELFLTTLQHLRDRHRGLLATGKGWQQASAREADESAAVLSQKLISKRRKNASVNVALIAAISFLSLVLLARSDTSKDFIRDIRSRYPALERLVGPLESSSNQAQEQISDVYHQVIEPVIIKTQKWGTAEFETRIRPHVDEYAGYLATQIHSASTVVNEYIRRKFNP